MPTTRTLPTMQHAGLEAAARDRVGLAVLDEDVSWAHLAAEPLGRLVILVDGAPHLVPVNHVVRDGEIRFVSVPGSKLHATRHQPGASAAFEVDGYDADAHTGWSVVVHGHLHPIDDLVATAGNERRGRPGWLDGRPDRQWLRLVPTQVDGRRLGPEEDDS